jgi:hypothetical protein
MKNKRMWALGIALILMAMVAGMVFAGEMDGVSWYEEYGNTYFINNNDYNVIVYYHFAGSNREHRIPIWANDTNDMAGSCVVIRVVRRGN